MDWSGSCVVGFWVWGWGWSFGRSVSVERVFGNTSIVTHRLPVTPSSWISSRHYFSSPFILLYPPTFLYLHFYLLHLYLIFLLIFIPSVLLPFFQSWCCPLFRPTVSSDHPCHWTLLRRWWHSGLFYNILPFSWIIDTITQQEFQNFAITLAPQVF